MKSLLLLLLLTSPALSDECYIVVDSQLATYLHEVAHCNGWRHEPFTNGGFFGGLPPIEYSHPFAGKLFVTVTDTDDIDILMIKAHAQSNAMVAGSNDNAATLCVELWHRYHVTVPDNTAGINSLIGCSVTLDERGWVIP